MTKIKSINSNQLYIAQNAEVSLKLAGNTAQVTEKQNTEQVKERTYIYGAGLIYETKDDEIYYHHYNNLGSTMYLTDDDGEI